MIKLEPHPAAVSKTMFYRYVIFAVIALAYFFVYFHRVSTSVMAPELTGAFNIGASGVGLFGSMYFWAYAAGQLPAGILADRMGARFTLTVFMVVAAAGSLLFAHAHSFKIALLGRFLVGFGVGFVYVPAMRFLADWFRSDEFATFSGVLVAIGNIGALAAATPLVALMAFIGWRGSMNLVGGVSLLIAVLCYLIIRNKPSLIGGASPAQIEGRPETRPADTYTIVHAIGMVIRKWNVWTILITLFIWHGTIMAFQGLWAGPWLINVYGMSKSQASNILSFIAVGMIFGCPMGGFMADKVMKSRFKVILLGIGITICFWLMAFFAVDSIPLGVMIVLMFIYGFFNGFFPIMHANIKENVDPSIQGTATGLLNTFAFAGAAVFQQITAKIIAKQPVIDQVMPVAAFKSAFGFCLLALIVAMALYLTQKPVRGGVQ